MPISNPPSFSSVRTEFNNAGIGLASNLNSYRKGGSIVPGNDIYYSGIGLGTSGSPLRLSQFAGKSGSKLNTLFNHSCLVDHTSSATSGQASSFSRLIVNDNGQLTLTGSTGWSSVATATGSIQINGNEYWDSSAPGSTETIVVQNWLLGTLGNTFSVRATIQAGSGTPTGFGTFRYGTFGSWVSVTSSDFFAVQAESVDAPRSITLIMLLEFARTADTSTVLGSCTITLSATADFNASGGGGGGGGVGED